MKRFIVATALLALVGLVGLSTTSFAAACGCEPVGTQSDLTWQDMTP